MNQTQFQKMFESVKEFFFNRYGYHPEKILVHMSVIGYILSSVAQMGAIIFNNKLTPEQKSYMLPQEAADGAINIATYLLISQSMNRFAKKLVSSGKLRTPKITEALKRTDSFTKQEGKAAVGDFNFSTRQTLSNNGEKDALNEYFGLRNGVSVIATLIGTILSSNIITPILRNKYASKKQQQVFDKHEQIYNHFFQKNKERLNLQAPMGITIDQYQNMAMRKYSSSLKV